MSYANTTGGFGGDSKSQLRSRLFFTGEVNDNWHYVAMLENNQFLKGRMNLETVIPIFREHSSKAILEL